MIVQPMSVRQSRKNNRDWAPAATGQRRWVWNSTSSSHAQLFMDTTRLPGKNCLTSTAQTATAVYITSKVAVYLVKGHSV